MKDHGDAPFDNDPQPSALSKPPTEALDVRQSALLEANNRWQNETRTYANRRRSFIEGAEWATHSNAEAVDMEQLLRDHQPHASGYQGFDEFFIACSCGEWDADNKDSDSPEASWTHHFLALLSPPRTEEPNHD